MSALLQALRETEPRHWAIIGFVLGTTTVLWVLAQFAIPLPADFWPWVGPSRLLAMLATALMALALVAGARSHSLEWCFGGLDRAVQLHRRVGVAALLLAAVHLLLLVPAWIQRGIPPGELFIPFYSPQARTLDILVTYGFVILAILAYNTRLRYDRWQMLHRVNGALFCIFVVDVHFFPGSITQYEPLRTWMIFLSIAGALSFVYRAFFFRRFGPRYRYRLTEVRRREGGAFDLTLRPAQRRMNFDPGNFAWIGAPEVPALAGNLHPFSISSSPVNRDLRFSIREVGHFTRAMARLPEGTAVDVYGPFGGFTLHAFMHYRRVVLIGAGIGITPFLSMLHFELTNNDFRRIWLYYVVRNREDAGYDEEIRESYLKADSYIDYALWVTREQGRITAAAIAEAMDPEFDDYAVMLCGTTAFNRDLARQFRALGVGRERIIAEEFAFR